MAAKPKIFTIWSFMKKSLLTPGKTIATNSFFSKENVFFKCCLFTYSGKYVDIHVFALCQVAYYALQTSKREDLGALLCALPAPISSA